VAQNPIAGAEPPAPNTGGRPPALPTDETRRIVRLMSGMGIPQSQIATIIAVTPKTLRKHYHKELKRSAINANLEVLKTLYSLATSGKNASASIFWAKTRCGFRSGLPSLYEPDLPAPASSQSTTSPIPPPPPSSFALINNDGAPLDLL
jgi:hypothetical protein